MNRNNKWNVRLLTWIILGVLTCQNSSWAEDVSVRLVNEGRSVYRVEGGFQVVAPPSTIWEVLTDYNRIDEFVPFMKRSYVKERREGKLLLEQEALAKFFLFTRTIRILQEVQEDPQKRILFRDVSHRDFEFYEGSWRVEPSKEYVWVQYEVRAKPIFSVPSFVARAMFKRTAQELLQAVRLEILRRRVNNRQEWMKN